MEDTCSEGIQSAMDPIAQNIDEGTEKEEQSSPVESTVKLSVCTYSLELVHFLIFFAVSLVIPVFQTEIIYQSCLLQSNESICRLLAKKEIPEELKDLETQLEIYVSKIFMAKMVLENIIPVFISVFIVQWSDRFGRKPLLLSSVFGYFSSYTLLCMISIASFYFKINPWFYLLTYIPYTLLGGTCTLSTGTYSYICDITSLEDRSVRMARIHAADLLGCIIGILTFAYTHIPAHIVFGLSAMCLLICFICVNLFVDESIEIETEQIGCFEKIRTIFDRKHVESLYGTCFKRRENNGRILVWLVIISLVLPVIKISGVDSVGLLFVRDKFKWVTTDYAIYAAFNLICMVFGNMIGTYVLNKMCGMPEILVTLISFLSASAESVAIALASYGSQLYIASAITMLKFVSYPLCSAYLTSLVPSSEVGMILSVVQSMQALFSIVAGPFYTFIYDNTIDTYAGAFNFVGAFISLVCILLMTTVFFIQNKNQETANYERMTR